MLMGWIMIGNIDDVTAIMTVTTVPAELDLCKWDLACTCAGESGLIV